MSVQINCLLIDDSDQEATIERIESLGRKAGVEIKCFEFNVGSQKLQELFYEKGKISVDKVIEVFQTRFDGTQFHLIAFDYDLEDAEDDPNKKVTGLTLISRIGALRRSCIKILYSSEIDDLIKNIIGNYNQTGNLKIAKDSIRALFLNGIVDFAGKEDYDIKIVDIISKMKNKVPLTSLLEEKLRKHGDLTFKSIYPPFKGQTLRQIAKIIENDPVQGYEFQKEMIEQLGSYIVDINADE